MIIDGRKLGAEVLARAKARAERLLHPPRVLAIVANDTPATKSYLAIKQRKAVEAGCFLEVVYIKSSLRPLEVFDRAMEAVRESDADAIIVQLPLPEGVDTRGVCDAIPLEKDADVLSTAARSAFEASEDGALVPPVAGAMLEILSVNSVNPAGKRAAIIGLGNLVGKPCATLLSHKGVDVARVSFRAGDFSALEDADIVVSGAGSPHFIKPEMLKEGAVLIDAGTSESGGALAGDADPACAEKCSIFTPVPGGVGPIAVAKLFENAIALLEKATK